MKNLLLFCMIYLTSQPSFSYNSGLLDFEADSFVNGIIRGRLISGSEVVRDLSFIDEEETDLLAEYRNKGTFASEEGPNEKELQPFYQLCRKIYIADRSINEEANVDYFFPSMVAVQMLYERVEKLYREYEKDSIVPPEFPSEIPAKRKSGLKRFDDVQGAKRPSLVE